MKKLFIIALSFITILIGCSTYTPTLTGPSVESSLESLPEMVSEPLVVEDEALQKMLEKLYPKAEIIVNDYKYQAVDYDYLKAFIEMNRTEQIYPHTGKYYGKWDCGEDTNWMLAKISELAITNEWTFWNICVGRATGHTKTERLNVSHVQIIAGMIKDGVLGIFLIDPRKGKIEKAEKSYNIYKIEF